MTVVATDNAELGDVADLHELTTAERRAITGQPLGSPYEHGDRLFGDWASGDVFDYGDPNARNIDAMLDSDGTARQLEQGLTLPIRGAEWALAGGSDKGRKTVMENIPRPQMDLLIAQQTSAFSFRKAFFELTWAEVAGKVHLDGIGFRPATSCQAAFDLNGRPIGFRQRTVTKGARLEDRTWEQMTKGEHPGWIRIPKQRSYIYTHGVHRQPLKGISDLSVTWWAYETRRKLLFLWLQYLETQSLPKTLAYGKDDAQSKRNAAAIAALRSGGVAPVIRPDDPTAKAFEILESSGKGADQFERANRYLESHMVDSVMGGFMKLATGAAASGVGSRALSEDSTKFFQQGRQAVANELALQQARGVFAPICIYNDLGEDDVPSIVIKVSRDESDRAFDLLSKVLSTPNLNAPDEFIDGLLVLVAPMLGLDPELLAEAIKVRRAELALQRDEASQTDPPAGPPTEQDSELANAIATLYDVVQLAQLSGDAEDAVRTVIAAARGRTRARSTVVDLADKKGAEPAPTEHTGGMVCLVPDAASAKALALTGDGAEPVDQLHVTLAYLGDDVSGMAADVRDELPAAIRTAIGESKGFPGVIRARAFAHTTFNADGGPDGQRKPCAVYGIGDSELLAPLQHAVISNLGDVDGLGLPKQHTPWVPHVTAAYDRTAADLKFLGPVVFDRIAVVLGGTWTFIPLTSEKETSDA